MNKAYKFRLYPNTEQSNLFAKTFGCCRFVYNQLLDLQQENYKNKDNHISRMDANNYCNRVLKVEYPFLKEVDKFDLTNVIYALETGFKKFFKKQGGFSKFKNKHRSRRSDTTNVTNTNIQILDGAVKLPKLGKVKAVIHRLIPDGY